MQDLKGTPQVKQEQFELEVLDRLNSKRLLNNLVFTGGTMLRLCFGLNRFSVDLDFWIIKRLNQPKLFKDLKESLTQFYTLRDAANKFNTILLELKSRDYPRSLKIEIRKETKKIVPEQTIAYSPYSNAQVFLQVVSLADMMRAKIEAFLNRKEVRDAFDIEFLVKKGIPLDVPDETLKRILKDIEALTPVDYKVKLGSLLEAPQRRYYINENFKILKSALTEVIKPKQRL
jgi:predicted nucleotidyltransferase component of viral defense system